MMSLAAAGLIGSAISGVTGLINNGMQQGANQQNIDSQNAINQRNIDFQKETNAKNEALMREGWARDDNAVQRRAADLAAAGINPLLAAGSAAGNSGPIALQSPQAGQAVAKKALSMPDLSGGAMALMQMRNQAMNQEAERELTKKQIEKMDSEITGQNVSNLNSLFGYNLNQQFGWNEREASLANLRERTGESQKASARADRAMQLAVQDRRIAEDNLSLRRDMFGQSKLEYANGAGARAAALDSILSQIQSQEMRRSIDTYNFDWYKRHALPEGSALNAPSAAWGLGDAIAQKFFGGKK